MNPSNTQPSRSAQVLIARAVAILAIIAYLISFFLPSWYFLIEGRPRTQYGYHAFLASFAYLFHLLLFGEIFAVMAWFANPAFWIAGLLLALQRNRAATVF